MNAQPPERVRGHMAREINGLLGEGFEPEQIRAGMRLMFSRRRLHPSLLASFVPESMLTGGTLTSTEIANMKEEEL
jgi:hypothetical protein